MKVLLHVCCAPCTIFPRDSLQEEGFELTGFFFNPNIHPFQEFQRRKRTLEEYSFSTKFNIIWEKEYGLREFVRQVSFREVERCQICYSMRLERTAAIAKDLGFDAFSTTLLYSKYQRHDYLSDLCQSLSVTYSVDFIYRDFRKGWQSGIDRSIEMNMYRQPYCGCIYSEQERYDKSFRKKNNNQ